MRYLNLIGIFALISTFVIPVSSYAGSYGGQVQGSVRLGGPEGITEPKGVFCEINDVRLFAKTSAECVKAGGVVTHTVNTEIKELNTDKK